MLRFGDVNGLRTGGLILAPAIVVVAVLLLVQRALRLRPAHIALVAMGMLLLNPLFLATVLELSSFSRGGRLMETSRMHAIVGMKRAQVEQILGRPDREVDRPAQLILSSDGGVERVVGKPYTVLFYDSIPLVPLVGERVFIRGGKVDGFNDL